MLPKMRLLRNYISRITRSRKTILLANLPQSSDGAEDWRCGLKHLLDGCGDCALPFGSRGVGGDDGEPMTAGGQGDGGSECGAAGRVKVLHSVDP